MCFIELKFGIIILSVIKLLSRKALIIYQNPYLNENVADYYIEHVDLIDERGKLVVSNKTLSLGSK